MKQSAPTMIVTNIAGNGHVSTIKATHAHTHTYTHAHTSVHVNTTEEHARGGGR